jgi:putative flippase GtrA
VKRKVIARDRHRCQVPGCQSTNIDVHHLHPLELGGAHDEWNLITLCEAHHLAIHRGTIVAIGRAPDLTFKFVEANRFTFETRVVDTKRELERRGFSKQVASAAVNAVRTHVGTQPLSSNEWLKLALARCPTSQN